MTMRRLTVPVVLFSIGVASLVLGQEAGSVRDKQTESEETASPPPLIFQETGGQKFKARDAWEVIERSPDLTEKVQLAERFLKNYPESDLTPYAHYVIARNAFQLREIEKFVEHAEKMLEDVGQVPDLQAELAFVYSERGRTEQAILRATQALGSLDALKKPPGIPAADWVSQTYQLKGEAYYALGRAHLNRMGKSEGDEVDPELKVASEYLEKALDYNPQHDYAAFRLGFARRNLNDADGTVMAYARAVAIGKVAAAPALRDLKQVLGILGEAVPHSRWAEVSVEEAVRQARVQIEKEMTEKEEEKAQLIQKIQASETFVPQAVPSSQPDKSSPSEGSETESTPPQR